MNPPRFSLIFYKDFPGFLRVAHPHQYVQRITPINAQRTPQRPLTTADSIGSATFPSSQEGWPKAGVVGPRGRRPRPTTPPPNPLSPSPLQQNRTFAHKYGIIYAKKLYFCRFFVNCAKCGEQLSENPDRECGDERVFVLKKHSLSSLGEAKRTQCK